MAIYYGPMASKMRGKVGEIVAAKTVGNRTALRAYNGKVKNPNTLRQQVSRNKLKQASELAALFSEAIGIGYAKAVQGLKMYARNMFVRELIPTENGYFTVTDGVVARTTSNLPLSRKAGINVAPDVTLGATAGGAPELTINNAADAMVGLSGNIAVIVVAVSETNNFCGVVKAVKPASGDFKVVIPEAMVAKMDTPLYAVFYKEVPEALNGVPTDSIPWKYPSATSECIYVE